MVKMIHDFIVSWRWCKPTASTAAYSNWLSRNFSRVQSLIVSDYTRVIPSLGGVRVHQFSVGGWSPNLPSQNQPQFSSHYGVEHSGPMALLKRYDDHLQGCTTTESSIPAMDIL
ncbi:unnamed protein product [Caenorhabditis brenneri]